MLVLSFFSVLSFLGLASPVMAMSNDWLLPVTVIERPEVLGFLYLSGIGTGSGLVVFGCSDGLVEAGLTLEPEPAAESITKSGGSTVTVALPLGGRTK